MIDMADMIIVGCNRTLWLILDEDIEYIRSEVQGIVEALRAIKEGWADV